MVRRSAEAKRSPNTENGGAIFILFPSQLMICPLLAMSLSANKKGQARRRKPPRATRLPSAAAPHRIAKAGRVGCADRRLKTPSRAIFDRDE